MTDCQRTQKKISTYTVCILQNLGLGFGVEPEVSKQTLKPLTEVSCRSYRSGSTETQGVQSISGGG